MPQQNFI
jgi:hypothetical protein